MKPIYDNPFAIEPDKILEQAKNEVQQFIDCDAKYASVPAFPDIVFQTSVEKYKKALRILRIHNVTVRRKKGEIILTKENLNG